MGLAQANQIVKLKRGEHKVCKKKIRYKSKSEKDYTSRQGFLKVDCFEDIVPQNVGELGQVLSGCTNDSHNPRSSPAML
ncbi:MAG: hypothetical protein RMJ60_04040, partial [Anaerolineales bacterium]|nr:hypothetical protein [Anaerolineales bacterium]